MKWDELIPLETFPETLVVLFPLLLSVELPL